MYVKGHALFTLMLWNTIHELRCDADAIQNDWNGVSSEPNACSI
jgi:hypothetical protein